jgi:hypothetical protein
MIRDLPINIFMNKIYYYLFNMKLIPNFDQVSYYESIYYIQTCIEVEKISLTQLDTFVLHDRTMQILFVSYYCAYHCADCTMNKQLLLSFVF